MEERQFHVELVTRARTVYSVRAPDVETARGIALRRWERRDRGDVDGFGGAELSRVRVVERSGMAAEEADDKVLLRYIRDREHLLGRSEGDAWVSDLANDAVSAGQAVADLRWTIPDSGDPPLADTLRATLSLRRLCAAGHLVRFVRPMVRAGERGEIHLFCTPEYLERVSDSVSVTNGDSGRPRLD